MKNFKLVAAALVALVCSLSAVGDDDGDVGVEVPCDSCSNQVAGQEFLIGSYPILTHAYEAAEDPDVKWPAYFAAMDVALARRVCEECEDPTGCTRKKKHNSQLCPVSVEQNVTTWEYEVWGLPADTTLWWIECTACPQPTGG